MTCQVLVVRHYGQELPLQTHRAVARPSGILVGLVGPRGREWWLHGETRCVACGQAARDHVAASRTRHDAQLLGLDPATVERLATAASRPERIAD